MNILLDIVAGIGLIALGCILLCVIVIAVVAVAAMIATVRDERKGGDVDGTVSEG